MRVRISTFAAAATSIGLSLLTASSIALADPVEIGVIKVMPVSEDRVVVQVKSTAAIPYSLKQTPSGAILALQNAKIPTKYVDGSKCLTKAAFLKPAAYSVLVREFSGRAELKFQSSRLKEIKVVTADSDFNAAVRETPAPVAHEKAQLASSVQRVTTDDEEGNVVAASPTVVAMVNNSASANALTTSSVGNDFGTISQAFNDFRDMRYKEAAAKLQTLMSSTKGPSELLVRLLGALYLLQGDKMHAVAVYAQGFSAYPNSLSLGYCSLLIDTSQYEKAYGTLTQLVKRTDLSVNTAGRANYMLGTLLLQKKRFAEARNTLETASYHIPESPMVLYNLAIAYEANDQLEKALATYRKASVLASGDFQDEIKAQINRIASGA